MWADSRDRFETQVLGPHLEHLCRVWAAELADDATFGGPVASLSSGVVNDATHRRALQVDVAVYGGVQERGSRLLSVGEVKWGRRMGEGDLRRLERVRKLLEARGDVDGPVLLACYSGGGFTHELHRLVSQREDVVLVDLERLYHGS